MHRDATFESTTGGSEALPLDSVEAQPRDRRRGQRRSVRLPLRYRFLSVGATRWSHGIVLNLGESGGAFLVDGAWDYAERVDGADGFRMEVRIGDPEGGEIQLAGSVVWVRPDGGGAEGIDRVGVRFTDVADDDLIRLRHVLRGRSAG
ncbi:MAG: PilZ domain-containing protein [Planctomycetes bacterium]|nr:PilZ domain-containing protein [Planctomycetota bacterium]